MGMGATAVEFRLRMAINAAIIVLGVWAPWLPSEKRVLVLEWLPLELARLRVLPFSSAVPAVLIAAGLMAALGAILRVWGTACLGPATVNSLTMKAGTVIADSPYRFLRNPLYVGLWCMVAAITLLMPPSGAALALVLLAFFLLRLTIGEESFLSARLGEPYRTYLHGTPRFLPRLRSQLPRQPSKPHWTRALLAELTPISVLIAVIALAWDYDAHLMGRIILIGFGLSLITRAFLPRPQDATTKSA